MLLFFSSPEDRLWSMVFFFTSFIHQLPVNDWIKWIKKKKYRLNGTFSYSKTSWRKIMIITIAKWRIWWITIATASVSWIFLLIYQTFWLIYEDSLFCGNENNFFFFADSFQSVFIPGFKRRRREREKERMKCSSIQIFCHCQ